MKRKPDVVFLFLLSTFEFVYSHAIDPNRNCSEVVVLTPGVCLEVGYNKDLPPPLDEEDSHRSNAFIHSNIVNIYEVDDFKQTISMILQILVTWEEPRFVERFLQTSLPKI